VNPDSEVEGAASVGAAVAPVEGIAAVGWVSTVGAEVLATVGGGVAVAAGAPQADSINESKITRLKKESTGLRFISYLDSIPLPSPLSYRNRRGDREERGVFFMG
jgi:hypothetical protein